MNNLSNNSKQADLGVQQSIIEHNHNCPQEDIGIYNNIDEFAQEYINILDKAQKEYEEFSNQFKDLKEKADFNDPNFIQNLKNFSTKVGQLQTSLFLGSFPFLEKCKKFTSKIIAEPQTLPTISTYFKSVSDLGDFVNKYWEQYDRCAELNNNVCNFFNDNCK